MIRIIQESLKQESTAGIILILAAILTMFRANFPWQSYYDLFVDERLGVMIASVLSSVCGYLWLRRALP